MAIITVIRVEGNVPVTNLAKVDKAAEMFDGDLDWDLDAANGIIATIEFCTEADKKGFNNLINRGDAIDGIKILRSKKQKGRKQTDVVCVDC